MTLLNKEFLLTNETGRKLFHQYAEGMPIIDFHCHLVPKEIYENQNYPNLTRIWINDGLFGDHYKWRLLRANGVPEELITGDGDEYQKLVAWAETLQKALGNPLYEWSHLELSRIFGIDEPFTPDNAKAVWDKANALLATDDFKPRALIRKFNVKVVCTTDDPASDLKYHKLLKAEETANGFKVLPAMRPDKAFAISAPGYADYLKELGSAAGVTITTFDDLVAAFDQRFDFFASLGGKLSDHGLNSFHFNKVDKATLDAIMTKAQAGETLTPAEVDGYTTGLIEALMRLNQKHNWTMQFHINVIRNANLPMFNKVGPDTGFDSMGGQPDIAQEMMKLYMDMGNADAIPKTIFYSLNPNDWMVLASGMGDFYGDGIKQKLQLGAAWWFNDTREGMREQLRTMAQQSLLGNFVGMLTDSRSFLSYPRHEYFRRVLCDYIGELAERGQVPDDLNILGKMVQDISYNNAHDYFGFFD